MVMTMVGDERDDVDGSKDNNGTRRKEFRKTVAAQQARNRRTDKHTEQRRRWGRYCLTF